MRRFFAAAIVGAMALSGPAAAQVDEDAIAAARTELEAARQELRRATERLAEALGEDGTLQPNIQVIRLHKKPIVGLVLVEQPENRDGVLVAAVTPGGPAEKAGVRSGDTLLSVNGTALSSPNPVDQARQLLAGDEPDTTFALKIRSKDGDERQIDVTSKVMEQTPPVAIHEFQHLITPFEVDGSVHIDFQQLQDSMQGLRENLQVWKSDDGVNIWRFGFRFSGLDLATVNAELGRYFSVSEGVLVLSNDEPEQVDGLKPGDVIVAVAGSAVRTPEETMRKLAQPRGSDPVMVDIIRDHQAMSVQIDLPERQVFSLGSDRLQR